MRVTLQLISRVRCQEARRQRAQNTVSSTQRVSLRPPHASQRSRVSQLSPLTSLACRTACAGH